MNKNKLKTNSGFMLIELVIYIALFTILIGGALTSVYAIIEGNARNQSKAMVEEEGVFLLGKIDWALSGARTATISPDGNTLVIEKFNGTDIVIDLTTPGDVSIQRNTDPVQNLNNSGVKIVEGEFLDIDPLGVEAIFTLRSLMSGGLPYEQEFSTIKFIRR